MRNDPFQQEKKAIKLLQDRAAGISEAHLEIASDLESLKAKLAELGGDDLENTPEHDTRKQAYIDSMSAGRILDQVNIKDVFREAAAAYPEPVNLDDFLSVQDRDETQQRIDAHIYDFNKRFALDAWDYAIACSCGLFASMLDIFFVRAPLKPTKAWRQKVDGVFNRWTQEAFNRIIPPDLGEVLCHNNTIGAPDTSISQNLLSAPHKVLSPINHRLRSLSHDPVLGLLFGVWDMLQGTCTVVHKGRIVSFQGVKGAPGGSVYQLLGRMFGHLLSDLNAPTTKGNRGMGLPAPFMGLLRMLEGVRVGDSNFAKQIEWMYIRGYDFRQFVATSTPMLIMEVLIRVFYSAKQVDRNGVSFGEAIVETLPGNIAPRFRMLLALAYGTSSAVNGGKVIVTRNILDANYASWMGLAWNGFHAMKWALVDKHFALWNEVTEKEISFIDRTIEKLEDLRARVMHLPG